MTLTRKIVLSWAAMSGLAISVLGICILFVAAVAGGAAEHESESSSNFLNVAGVPNHVPGINQVMLSAYAQAAQRITSVRPKCTGMRWSVVAGIGKVESNHAAGRKISANGDITPRILGARLDGGGVGGNTRAVYDTDGGRWDGDTTYDRAVGPMQFIPSTWEGPSGADGNGDGLKDPNNAFDAALGTALYLCGTGTANLNDTAQLRKAILRYNHAGWYADEVIEYIHQYDQLSPAAGNEIPASDAASAVITAALEAQGIPYVWGGGDINGPTKGGFDCSGLMVYAFYKGAHITLPRTSQAMRNTGRKVARSDLQPGDLIVFNNDRAWGHVGLYIGSGKMVDAPRPGKSVETAVVTKGYWTQFDWSIRRVL